MDESYLLVAVRYVELNPVRAGLVKEPWAYPWSSAHVHLTREDDKLVKVTPLLEMVSNWLDFLSSSVLEKELEEVGKHERTGRPLGDEGFVEKPEGELGRILVIAQNPVDFKQLNAKCKLKIGKLKNPLFCILKFAFCIFQFCSKFH